MKRLLVRLLLVIAVVGVALGAYVYHRVTTYLATPIGEGTRIVTIPPGASFRQAVAVLAEAGVVKDPLVFEWYGRYRDLGGRIRAGEYSVDLALNPLELLEKLEQGTLPRRARLTIPEGFNRWQIADRVAATTAADRAAFLAQVEAQDLEGRLFPDTYFFKPEATTGEVLKALTRRFDQVFAEVTKGHPDAAKLQDPAARKRLLTLASLVEKEARTDRDRALVSRVFHNRLAQGMKLQTDPTCVYREDLYQQVPHPRFCRDSKSLYSTYVIAGLPPGPIANPGRAALQAALRPADDAASKEFLYFVARRDGSGEHVFSRTYEEHQAAVNRHLKGIEP